MAETFETIQAAANAREDTLNGGLRIRVGVALCGEAAGVFEVLEALKGEVASRGLAATVQEVGCIGLCYAEPLVDVMLVLLVVFMITAPLLTVGVEIDLPKAESEALSGDDEPLTVSIDAEGQLFLQETQIEIDELGPKLIAITGENPEARIFIRGDQAIDYGRVMQVMSTINMAGFTKVALITVTPIGEKPGG